MLFYTDFFGFIFFSILCVWHFYFVIYWIILITNEVKFHVKKYFNKLKILLISTIKKSVLYKHVLINPVDINV